MRDTFRAELRCEIAEKCAARPCRDHIMQGLPEECGSRLLNEASEAIADGGKSPGIVHREVVRGYRIQNDVEGGE